MADYYDRENRDGKKPQKKTEDSAWYIWPLIIILFSTGLWPVALFVLFFNIFGKKKKSSSSSSASQRKTVDETVDSAVERALARAQGKPVSGGAAATSRVNAGEKKAGKKKKEKTPGKLLRILGICFLVIGAIVALDTAAEWIQYGPYYLDELFAGLGFLGAGGIMLGRGQFLAQMSRRSQRYILAIGTADAMRLEEIAKRVNRTPRQAAKELQKLIDKGYLGEDAYIDHNHGYFLRFGAAPEEEKPAEPRQEEAEYTVILQNIRRANDRIADEEFSRKIDRLEQISRLIFREVEEHPEKRQRIRTFFDYYLPTTQKLLDTYAEFEETGVDGEHLRQAKDRIEQTMDSIVKGFEHQMDQLYSADAMDVVSDIKVMETMINRDTASAARDFGYDRMAPGPEKSEEKRDEGGLQQMRM